MINYSYTADDRAVHNHMCVKLSLTFLDKQPPPPEILCTHLPVVVEEMTSPKYQQLHTRNSNKDHIDINSYATKQLNLTRSLLEKNILYLSVP